MNRFNPKSFTARKLVLPGLFALFLLTSLTYYLNTVWAGPQTATVLQGRVVNESEQPIPGATVTVSLEGTFIQSVITLPDGQFNVNLPGAGQYTVTIAYDGFRPLTEVIPLDKDETLFRPFKLVPSSLQVIVLDSLQEKLSDANVTVKGDDGAVKRAIESPKGNYYFGRLKPGIYQLSVLMPGFELIEESVYITSDNKTMPRTVLLQRASTIPLGEKLKDRYTVPVLPSNRVQTICQDEKSGVIWIGTANGVARFNGSEINTSDGQDSLLKTFAGQDIKIIFQDGKGNIWFITNNGVLIKSPASEALDTVTLLGNREIRALAEDNHGALWFATNQGVVRIFDKNIVEYNTRIGLPSDDVRHVVVEKDGGTIWVATNNGVAKIERGSVTPLMDRGEPVVWNTNFILEDSRHTLWFLTENGVRRKNGDQIITTQKDGLTRNFRTAVEDRLGNLWFAADDKSVLVYDLRRDEIDDQLGSDRVLALISDREGNVWFGTENGAIRHDLYSFVSFTTSRGLPDVDTNALLPDPNQPDALWVGTATGLIYFDGVRFRRSEGIPFGVSVRHIFQQSTGALWFATSNGLYRLYADDWRYFGNAHGLANTDILFLNEDVRDGKLWVGTKSGVLRFDTSMETILQPIAATEQLNITAEVRYIYQQRSGMLWFATNRGVYRYDPATNDLTIISQSAGLESTDVRWIEGDETGRLWIGTAKGVDFYNGQRIEVEKRLPGLTGENIQSIFRDRDGMVWLGSNDGKVKKYLNTGIANIPPIITTYTRDRHGLAGNIIRAITQDSSGAIWLATESGLSRHLPSKALPPVHCRLEVNGAEIPPGTEIEAGRHNIKFKFIGMSTFGDVCFIHRIIVNGAEREFLLTNAQSGLKEALFNDLPYGEHIFEVRALNRDLYGVNGTPLTVRLRIDRPFWRKSWFLLFIGLTMTSATITTVVLRQRQRREYNLPPHLKTFVPIDPNPYIVGNPIRTPSMFFGREDDFNYLKIKLEGAAQGGVVMVFCGERRAGKSSILYQILNGRLGDRFVPVFIDLQEMVVSNEHEFFGRIARIISEAISQIEEEGQRIKESPTIELRRYPFSDHSKNAFHLFIDYLDSVLAALGERRMVLLIDEYELLENKVEDGKLSKEIFNFLASMIDNRDRLSFVFTGTRRLEERDRRYWRELLRRSLFRKVSFLSERDAKRLITYPVRDKLIYGKGVEDRIYRLTSGHPFYTQYICQSIVDHLNEWKRNYVLKSDLDQVTSEIVDNPLPQMLYFWEGFSDDEKLVMSLLSEVLKDGEGTATSKMIVEAIQREHYPVKLSDDTIRLTLEELFRNDVLKKIGDDSFCFKIDLFRLWIKQSHSIWRVVREVRTL